MSRRSPNESWGTITPHDVASWMNFSKAQRDWTYQQDRTMESRQAEGVAHLWNVLGARNLALLADEVGMGKTFQALGVLCLLWKMKPDAKVLILAPNRDICRHWASEYRSFIKDHYCQVDHLVKSAQDDAPIKDFVFCANHLDLCNKVEKGAGHAYVATIHMLSGMVRDIPEGERSTAAARQGTSLRKKLMDALGDRSFDLLIVDEAHYFRRSDGESQRAKAAATLFSPNNSPLAQRTLLMTATPSHSGLDDIARVLGTFHVLDPDLASQPATLLETYALRRLRQMRGKKKQLFNKHNYRKEIALGTDFSTNPNAELFFAQYQRQLVRSNEKRRHEGRQFLYGYLEGFESVPSEKRQSARSSTTSTVSSEDNGADSYVEADDSKLLSTLSKEFHAIVGRFPEHPKYDGLIRHVVPQATDNDRPHKHKHLIFVRRIPSVREITQRINQDYDTIFAIRIIKSWHMDPKDPIAVRWQKRRWSREGFIEFVRIARSRAGLVDTEDDLDAQPEPEGDEPSSEQDDVLGSRITNLFVTDKSKSGSSSTDCSRIRLRFRKPESLFSLFMEPAADYKTAGYRSYLPAGKSKPADYSTWARNSRLSRLGDVARDTEHDQHEDRSPQEYRDKAALPTAWGLMYSLLSADEKSIIDRWHLRNGGILENFADYIQSGFLYASPVMIELYCWYTQSVRDKPGQRDVQSRYQSFIDTVKKNLPTSMMLKYFKEALSTFEDFCEKIAGRRLEDYKSGWRVFTNLQNPAWYASGETTNRQYLITGFNSPFFPNVLTATAVFQEGVNLHMQCSQVHHYGIAWTPGDNEQRIGRVDRLFGQINRQLAESETATLDIRYPFLSGTFDEDQIASFIMRKLRVEGQLDKCLQSEFDKEIDLGFTDRDWQRYLRAPIPIDQDVKDPYPANPEAFAEGFKPYTPYQLGIGDDLYQRVRSKLLASLQQYPIHIAVPKENPRKNLLLIDPTLPTEAGIRRQPVIAELCYSAELSSVANPVAYYVSFRSPLSTATRVNEIGLAKVITAYKEIQAEYPMAKLAIDHQHPQSWFFLQVKADLPVLVHHKHFDMLSSNEIRIAFEHVKSMTDRLERVLFSAFSQDLPKEHLEELSINPLLENRPGDTQKPKRERLSDLDKPWRRILPFRLNMAQLSKKFATDVFQSLFVDGQDWTYVTKGRRRSKQTQDEILLTLNNIYPFLSFCQHHNNVVAISLPFPVEDLQNEERALLENWFSLVAGEHHSPAKH